MFFVSIHILTALRQSVSTTFIFMLNSLLFAILYIVLQESMRLHTLDRGAEIIKKGSVSNSIVYFFRLQQLIDRRKRHENLIVHGIFQ